MLYLCCLLCVQWRDLRHEFDEETYCLCYVRRFMAFDSIFSHFLFISIVMLFGLKSFRFSLILITEHHSTQANNNMHIFNAVSICSMVFVYNNCQKRTSFFSVMKSNLILSYLDNSVCLPKKKHYFWYLSYFWAFADFNCH